MTTEETYAIQRLKVCTEIAFASEDSHVTFFRDDAVTLLAEVERLRAEVDAANVRADEAEMWDVRRGDNPLEQENARLRAEREALHSDDTRERIRQVEGNTEDVMQVISEVFSTGSVRAERD